MNTHTPSGVHRVLSDVADLAELQLQLLSIDGREAGRRGIGALIFLGIAGALLISTITVGLIGLGWLLHEVAGWSVGWSLLAMAAVALVLTGIILLLAYLSAKKASAAIEETGTEFAENLRWLRTIVTSPASVERPMAAAPHPDGRYGQPAGAEWTGGQQAVYSR